MSLFWESSLIERNKSSSLPYFVVRLACIGLGFVTGNLAEVKIETFRPVCLSLCITNIYMFVYLENAIARKNIEQCKIYWIVVLLSCMEACAIIATIIVIGPQRRFFLIFFEIYLVLCVVEFFRIYFMCGKLGDIFEWFYFKYGGACIELRSKFEK